MQLRYNFRLYPTPSQQQSLAQAFGCARVVFNDGLAIRTEAHENKLPYISDGDLSKAIITEAKKTPQRAWLGEVSAVVLQQALADLNVAYRNFFASVTGRRKGPKMEPPRYRSRKDNRQSIRFTKNAAFKITAGGKLRLPKIGDVPVRWSRSLPSEPSSVTVIKDASGRYFASFVVTTDDEPLPECPDDAGIDLGLTHFAVTSDGRKEAAPKFFRRAERKLRKAQKALDRKQKGSANRRKAALQVARVHAEVADARRDFHHKLSTTVVRDNQAIYVEDLAVNGLGRTRLAKSVHDAGWSSFVNMLEYKAAKYGRTFAKVDRWFASSQICSACGVKDGPKPLYVREWTCQACGITHDRDVNAAINIRNEGRRMVAAGHAETLNARGAKVRPGSVIPAQRDEAGTHPKLTPATGIAGGNPLPSGRGGSQLAEWPD